MLLVYVCFIRFFFFFFLLLSSSSSKDLKYNEDPRRVISPSTMQVGCSLSQMNKKYYKEDEKTRSMALCKMFVVALPSPNSSSPMLKLPLPVARYQFASTTTTYNRQGNTIKRRKCTGRFWNLDLNEKKIVSFLARAP